MLLNPLIALHSRLRPRTRNPMLANAELAPCLAVRVFCAKHFDPVFIDAPIDPMACCPEISVHPNEFCTRSLLRFFMHVTLCGRNRFAMQACVLLIAPLDRSGKTIAPV